MAQEQKKVSQGVGGASTDPAAQSMNAAFAAALAAPQKIAELASESLGEWMDFASRRAKAQAEFFGGLSHCHDLSEAADVQRQFVSKCANDYSDEFTQLTTMGRRNMERMASLMQSGGKRSG